MCYAVFHSKIGCDSILADDGEWFPLILRRKLFLYILVISFRVPRSQTFFSLIPLANQVLTGCFTDVPSAQLVGTYTCYGFFTAVHTQVLHLKRNISSPANFIAMMPVQNDSIPDNNWVSTSLRNQASFQFIMFGL